MSIDRSPVAITSPRCSAYCQHQSLMGHIQIDQLHGRHTSDIVFSTYMYSFTPTYYDVPSPQSLHKHNKTTQTVSINTTKQLLSFSVHNKTNKCVHATRVYDLLFVQQHVSTAVAIIIRVTYKNIMDQNKFVKLYKWTIQVLFCVYYEPPPPPPPTQYRSLL